MYAYHATLKEFLPSIAQKGLFAQFSDVYNEDVIFVERNYDQKAIYRGGEKGVMLRLTIDGIGDTELGEYVIWDTLSIHSSKIKFELFPNTWKPLA